MDADWSHDPTAPAGAGRRDRACRRGNRFALRRRRGDRRLAVASAAAEPRDQRLESRGAAAADVRHRAVRIRAYRVAKLRELRLGGRSRRQVTPISKKSSGTWLGRGPRFAEVPITFRQRRAGASKMSVREAAGKLGTMLRLSLRRGRP